MAGAQRREDQFYLGRLEVNLELYFEEFSGGSWEGKNSRSKTKMAGTSLVLILLPIDRDSEGFKQGADTVTCQPEDDSSKNVENGV